MSTLTDALNRIMRWLEQNRPNYAATFIPGLTAEEIQQKVSNLQFQLPEEIYELYRWRNGSQDEDLSSTVYPSFGFMPLDEALEYYHDFVDNSMKHLCEDDYQEIFNNLDEHEASLYHHKYMFQFYRSNCSFCAVFLSSEQQQHSPVIDIADELDMCIIFKSVTAMMQTFAEYLETGAHYLGEEDFLFGDEDKMLPIFQKYNPGLKLMG